MIDEIWEAVILLDEDPDCDPHFASDQEEFDAFSEDGAETICSYWTDDRDCGGAKILENLSVKF